MGDGFQFYDIILLALIAGFILLRLRNTLGKRSGFERPPTPPGGERDEAGRAGQGDNVIALPGAEAPSEDDKLPAEAARAVGEIRAVDPGFEVDEFLSGARAAYEMVVAAFAQGDLDTLRGLLSNEVFANFAGAIEARDRAGEKLETTLVGIDAAELIEGSVRGRMAELTVRFASAMISVTRDAQGQAIDGDPKATRKVIDVWTFGRNLKSSDPNWSLIATRSEDA
ncbi:MAG: Tim44 domain-containing protein [Alphaproteobacteria bacterium]|nr:Tim44 domain-containing protein [Alphaproteobacteria bacterium]